MANIRLVDNTWDTSGVYDRTEEKTQDEINAQVVTHLTALDNNKADIDGSYSAMIVGNAEQLVSTVGVEDSAPYVFRTTGGSADVGDRKEMMIIGGTIGWNQQIQNGNFADGTTGWGAWSGSISASDGILSLSATGSQVGTATQVRPNGNVHIIKDHVCYVSVDVMATVNTTGTKIGYGTTGGTIKLKALTANVWDQITTVFKADQTRDTLLYYLDNSVGREGTLNLKNVVFFDLTLMFGPTVANYVYGLEQANAMAGVEWVRTLFPNSYYSYNAGQLLSVNTSANITRGFNAWNNQDFDWDEGSGISINEDELIVSRVAYQQNKNRYRVVRTNTSWHMEFDCETTALDNSSAYFKVDAFYTDGSVISMGGINLISVGTKQHITLNNTYSNKILDHISFGEWGYDGTVKLTNICLNLSWDGERDGEYEEYKEITYALDSSLILRGIPKLDSGHKLYYDGDIYENDGMVTRRYAVFDLGTPNWGYNSEDAFFSFEMSGINGVPNNNTAANMICHKYQTTPLWSGFTDKCIALTAGGNQIRIKDSAYSDASTFKTAMSGVYLVYELNTPTTDEAEPFNAPQIVDDFGTEEFVDYAYESNLRDVKIPVGNNSVYRPNLRAKLEMAPDSPDGDGDYIVRQTDGENEYVPLIIPNELPEEPSTDGTYHLQLVIVSGEPTLSWVSAT